MTFQLLLRQLEASLDVPYPARGELLKELRAHLGAMYEDFEASGCTPEQAYERCLDAMALDDDFLDSIGAVHRPVIARALARLPRSVSLGLEYGLIGLASVLIFVFVLSQEAIMLHFILDGGIWMIPLNLVGLGIVVLFVERLYSLFMKKDHSRLNLRKRLTSLRFLGILAALVGVLGTLVGFYEAFSRAPEIAARHEGEFPVYLVASIAVTTTIWGLSLTVLAEIAHFIVRAKGDRIDAMRAESI